ncbi:MAG: Serine/threonine-protein kinase PknD [Chlamydiia bacterium]|nr:Serine/threonine-protein kinase PknD [Chlamydiia bacterium]
MTTLSSKKYIDPAVEALTTVNNLYLSTECLPEVFTRKDAAGARAKVDALFRECDKIVIAPAIVKRKRILDVLHLDPPRHTHTPTKKPDTQVQNIELGHKSREGLFARVKAGTLRALNSLRKPFKVVREPHVQKAVLPNKTFRMPQSTKKIALKRTLGEEPKLTKSISSGSFGEVCEVHQGQNRYAEKSPKKPKLSLDAAYVDPDEADRKFKEASQLLDKEATILMQLGSHPHIIPVEAFSDKGIYLQLGKGNLTEVVKDSSITPQTLTRYMKELAMGLRYIHSQGFTHKDLKSSNILLDSHDHVRVCDFGISVRSVNDHVFAGTHRNIAPEVYCSGAKFKFLETHPLAGQARLITPQADIWSLGVIFFELLTGKHPYPKLPGESSKESGERHALKILNLESPEYKEIEKLRTRISNKAKTSLQRGELIRKYRDLLPIVKKQHEAALKPAASLFTSLDEGAQARLERLDPTGELRLLTLHCLHGNPGIWIKVGSSTDEELRSPIEKRRPDSTELLTKLQSIESRVTRLPRNNLLIDSKQVPDPSPVHILQSAGKTTSLVSKMRRAEICSTGSKTPGTDTRMAREFEGKIMIGDPTAPKTPTKPKAGTGTMTDLARRVEKSGLSYTPTGQAPREQIFSARRQLAFL